MSIFIIIGVMSRILKDLLFLDLNKVFNLGLSIDNISLVVRAVIGNNNFDSIIIDDGP